MEAKTGEFKEHRRISRLDWDTFFSEESTVIYDPKLNQILIKRSTTGSASINNGDVFIYDVDNASWSFGKNRFITNSASLSPKNTNAVTISDGSVYMLRSKATNTDGKFMNTSVSTEGGEPITEIEDA